MKIVQLESGEWLSRNGVDYSSGSGRLSIEDAIATLTQHWQMFPAQTNERERQRFESMLRRRLPEEDYSLFKQQLEMDWKLKRRADDEKWIVEMLQHKQPPSVEFAEHWEELHRIAIKPPTEEWPPYISVATLDLTFQYHELWCFLQRHRPRKSPLRLWEVCYGCADEGRPGKFDCKSLQITRMWAFSEETLRKSWDDIDAWGTEPIIWVKEV
jgi:hypothetical protein